MTKLIPNEIYGSIFQFLPLKNIPLIAKTYNVFPKIFLSYHNLDNFLDKIYLTTDMGHLTDNQLELMLKNVLYPKESILLYTIKTFNIFLCEYILKNNKIDFKKIYGGILKFITSSFNKIKSVIHLLLSYGLNPDTRQFINKLIDTHNTAILKMLIYNNKICVSKYNNEVFKIVKLGRLGLVKYFVIAGIDPSFDNNKLITEAIHLGNYNIVKFLLKQETVIETLNINIVSKLACRGYGHQGYLIAKKLLKLTNPSFNNNICFTQAVISGNYETIKMLLSYNEVNPADNNNQAIITATQGYNNSVIITKLLLSDKRVDPRARNNLSLIGACRYKKYEIVKTILDWIGPNKERVDPNDGINNMTALSLASQEGNIQIVKLLLSDKRINPGSNNGIALRVALHNKKEEVAIELLKWRSFNQKRIVPHWSTINSNENPIVIACLKNLLKVFKILIKDPGVCFGSNIIIKAYKYPEILKILLSTPGISPAVNNNECLRLAVSEYKYASIKLLLKDPRTNVNGNDGKLLLIAIKSISKDNIKKKIDVIEILLLHPKIEIYSSHLLSIIEKKEYILGTSKNIDRIFKIDPMYKRGLPVIYALRCNHMEALRVICKHPNFNIKKIVPDVLKKAYYTKNKEAIDILYKYNTSDYVKSKKMYIKLNKTYVKLTWNTFRTLLKENGIIVSGLKAGEFWKVYLKHRVHNNSYTRSFIKSIKM